MYKNLYNFTLVAVGAIAIALGIWGFSICDGPCQAALATQSAHAEGTHAGRSHESYEPDRIQRVLRTLDLVRGRGDFEHPWQLVVAQLLLPCVALLAVAQVFITGLRRDLRVFLARHKRGHTIVCGLGNVGMQVVQNMRRQGQPVVCIDLNVDSPSAVTLERVKVPVLKGNAANPDVLLSAGIRKAKMVIVCTGSDAVNVDIALGIQKLVQSSPQHFRKLTILAELRDEWLYSRLINHDKQALSVEKAELRFFNSYATAARTLVGALQLPPSPEVPADTIAMIGFGSSGREAALHLLRAQPVPLGSTLKFRVFDQKASQVEVAFQNTFPTALGAAHFEFITAKLATDSADLVSILEPGLRAHSLLAVVVCLSTDEDGLFVALEARSLLDRIGQLHVPIYLCLEHCRRLGDFAGEIERVAQVPGRLSVFGTFEELFSPRVLLDEDLDVLARAFHEDYRHRSKEHINPLADVLWHELPEFMKMSNRWRADHLPIMLGLAGFRLKKQVTSPAVIEFTPEEIDVLAQHEHRRYTIERRLLDWTSGSERHHGHHRTPHLLDWETLSEPQKEWNRHEAAHLPKMLADLGIEVQRSRKIHAYGSCMAKASVELEQALKETGSFHYMVLADIDEKAGQEIAARSLALPSASLWLTSRETPPELFQGRRRSAAPAELSEAIAQSQGWIARNRVVGE